MIFIKIGIVSDLHLGNRQYGLRTREIDFYNQFDKVVNKINDLKCDLLIIAGDLFNNPNPSPEAISRYNKSIKNLNCRVVAIKGNHTMILRDDHFPVDNLVAEGHDNYYLLEDEGMSFIDSPINKLPSSAEAGLFLRGKKNPTVHIDGINYRGETHIEEFVEVQKKLAANIDNSSDFNILVVHEAFTEYCGFTGVNLSIKDLNYEPYNVILCGHVHTRTDQAVDENTVFIQPGSIERLNSAEALDESKNGKGFYLIDTNNSNIEFHPVESIRPFLTGIVDLGTSEDIENFFTELQDKIDSYEVEPLVNYKYTIPDELFDSMVLHNNLQNILINKSTIDCITDDDDTSLVITEDEVPTSIGVVKWASANRFEDEAEGQLFEALYNACDSKEELINIGNAFYEKHFKVPEDFESDFEISKDVLEVYDYFEHLEIKSVSEILEELEVKC